MELSYIGLAVSAVVLLAGWALGSAPLYGLMLALPLGSTAFATLPALGGSTPQIYTLFAMLLVAQSAARADCAAALRAVFAGQRAAWLVVGLTVLALVGAAVLPRLFEGAMTVPFPVERSADDMLLQPTAKNVSQSGYLLLDALVYLALAMQLAAAPRRRWIVTAFFVWSGAHTALGVVDLIAKHAGYGDVFAPIRTAAYAFLATDVVAGFPRLTAALPEASTFATMSLGCLGFAAVYWQHTGSRPALALTLANILLLLLSTSTTAYVGLAVLALPFAWHAGTVAWRHGWAAALRTRPARGLAAAAAMVVVLAASGVFGSYGHLIDVMVVDKPASQSGVERAHFNRLSIGNLIDTGGLGIGLGSSRTSSWVVAVLAQLGVPGAILMALLALRLLRGMRGIAPKPDNAALLAAGDAVAAAAIGGLIASALSGASANPGTIFFVALAVVESWRWHAAARPAGRPR
jgi:hypothetical protein